MSDADEERIFADLRRRANRRELLMVPVGCAVAAAMFIPVLGFHLIGRPLRWQSIALVMLLPVLVGVVGSTAAWWVTRFPPGALTARMTLRQSDRVQHIMSRLYLFYPIVIGIVAFDWALLVHRVLKGGWQILDVTEGLMLTFAVIAYVPALTGWGVGRMSRLIYDEELFRSFRTRGYVAGFWSIMAGLPVILALGLARPAWAVEALPFLIAVGISAPALTMAHLNRRAERDA
ncbi:MAG TPA: hypothetical protein VLI41_11800 [Phenylobacterium sp.]|uniref:hypothetical protein n=1 Tax=Phenylobacterium sp. TaxID=1871053 RepID=UPI002BE43A4A|nr:hypothetical protein [Phenylobacterium sp.]HSV03876.1 hypothetical protein [Phenylobacterium sp.]